MHDLAWLLHPIAVAELTDRYWEKDFLHVTGRPADYYAALMRKQDLASVLGTPCRIPGNDARPQLVRGRGVPETDEDDEVERRPVDADVEGRADVRQLFRGMQDGFSVLVPFLDRRWAAAEALARDLERTLHHRIGVNMYVTPPAAQGFVPHYDTHDVLVLQVEGSKEWCLYDPFFELPLVSQQYKITRQRLPRVRATLTMRAGDLLYMPRGMVHEARTSRDGSIHVTVRLEVFRWLDVLRGGLLEAAEEDARLREAVPPGWLLETDAGRRREWIERACCTVEERGLGVIAGLGLRNLSHKLRHLPPGETP